MQRLIDENKGRRGRRRELQNLRPAMMSVANPREDPLILPAQRRKRNHRQDCSRYVPHQATVPVQINGLMPYVQQIGKKVYFITPPTPSARTSCLRPGAAAGDRRHRNRRDEVPINTADYSSFILKIRQAKPDVVIGGLCRRRSLELPEAMERNGDEGQDPTPPWPSRIPISGTSGRRLLPASSSPPGTTPTRRTRPPKEDDRRLPEEIQPAAVRQDVVRLDAMRALLESIESAKSTNPQDIVTALEKWKNTEGEFPFLPRVGPPAGAAGGDRGVKKQHHRQVGLRGLPEVHVRHARGHGEGLRHEAEQVCEQPCRL